MNQLLSVHPETLVLTRRGVAAREFHHRLSVWRCVFQFTEPFFLNSGRSCPVVLLDITCQGV